MSFVIDHWLGELNTDQDLFIIPNIGLRYANYKDSAYSEYGAGVHNISVKAKSNNTFSAIAGINLMMYKKPSENLLIATTQGRLYISIIFITNNFYN